MKKEILEGNKLIAEFMGWTQQLNVEERWYGAWDDQHGIRKAWPKGNEPLLFHESWDWLIPVVERIEKMPLHELIYKTSSSRFPIVYMYQNRCIIKDTGDQTIANVFDGRGRLMATYGAVIEFIIWYNLNNKNNFN